jgi:hypothetical protein
MRARGGARRRAEAALGAAGLLLAIAVSAQPAGSRLLVIDLPYAKVWENAVRAMGAYPVARAADGVIESDRIERPPRADEPGLERVAERITVRVEEVARLVTRVAVEVRAEGLRGGRWEPLRDGEATARAVLVRIRAAQG